MKYPVLPFCALVLVAPTVVALFATTASEPTTVTTVSAKLIIIPRSELQTEIPQPDGLMKKQFWVNYEDRVLQCTFNGELISATNTIDTGKATVKLVPEDPRRAR